MHLLPSILADQFGLWPPAQALFASNQCGHTGFSGIRLGVIVPPTAIVLQVSHCLNQDGIIFCQPLRSHVSLAVLGFGHRGAEGDEIREMYM
jgi:hypothetical protein